jgi:ubiquinone/menaquinone biosynthesis C-methylase UbiE
VANERLAEAYDLVADDYQALIEPSLAKMYRRIVQLAGVGPDCRALDIATGTGGVATAAAAAGADVVGVDISPRMLELASKKAGISINFQVGDAARLGWPNESFDVVTCGLGLSHIHGTDSALSEVKRVLVAGGTFVASAWGVHALNPSGAAVQNALNRYSHDETARVEDLIDEERWHDIARSKAILDEVGFTAISVHRESLSGVHSSPVAALKWTLAWASCGSIIGQISDAARNSFLQNALEAINRVNDLSWAASLLYYVARKQTSRGETKANR